jgi:hypothetical protein
MYNTDIRVYVFCGTCGGVLLPSHFYVDVYMEVYRADVCVILI